MQGGIVRRMSRLRIIALGFLIMIAVGTLLLMLPVSAADRSGTGFLTALFTAASACCVTGLIVTDTAIHWSFFGQLIILILIQIGGLSFISIGFGFSLFFQRRITIRQRGMLRESMNIVDMNGIVRLAKLILHGTFLFEGAGAVILTICFLPDMGFPRALWYGIFHSVSAFCNAGFDLMAVFGDSSFTAYNASPVICLTLSALILIGGIGFFVWEDLKEHKLHVKKYALHTKLVLSVSSILTAGGAFLFFLLERNALFADMTPLQTFLNALFCAVTPRTAGFNMIDTAALTDSSKLLTIVLMFIGGCPGSTAGGIKVTTIAVLLLYLRSTYLRTDGVNVFRRRLGEGTVHKATAVFSTNFFLVLLAVFLLSLFGDGSMMEIIFEAVSAISTVGMSLGITAGLSCAGKVIIILLMYLGRVGSLSFAMAFTDKKRLTHVKLPQETVNIG